MVYIHYIFDILKVYKSNVVKYKPAKRTTTYLALRPNFVFQCLVQ